MIYFVTKLLNSKIFRYLLVGGSAYILDISSIWFMHEILFLELWISTVIAGLMAFIFTFTLQRNFAFQSKSPTTKSFYLYLLLVIFNMIATVVFVEVGDIFGSWEIGRTLAALVIPIWNFYIYNRLIFPQK